MMNIAQIKKLQTVVGVRADGIIGRGTLSALFRKLGASNARAEELALAANVHLRNFGILDNSLRFIHFMAQLTHESGNFRYMEEIASGKAYEGRKDLGNIHAGDGVRYKGRGPIQLTGRANYRRYGQQLGIDLENNPQIVALPSMGLMVACKFWSDNGLNALADKDDVVAVTRRINGGTNGLEDRKKHLALLRSWV